MTRKPKHTANRHLSKDLTDLLKTAKLTLRQGVTEGHGLAPEKLASLIASGKITRQMSCDGKARFRTYEYAENEVRPALEAKYGKKYDTYACGFCNAFHLATRGEFAA